MHRLLSSRLVPLWPQGPLFGGKTLDATDAAFAPKLYHIMVALARYKVRPLGPTHSSRLCWPVMMCTSTTAS